MNTEHARLAPSSAHIWVNCPGSVRATEAMPPQEETDDTREGTAAHWLLAECLRQYAHGDLVVAQVGVQAPNGVVTTEEMAEGASLMVDDVRDLCVAKNMQHTLRAEERVDMSGSVHLDNWGTPDAWAYDEKENTLYVWDFKYGHRFVEAVENWQLINYAAGLLYRYEPARVVFRVVQPRCYYARSKIREWAVPSEDLAPRFQQLAQAAAIATSDLAHLDAGHHCRDCRARAVCPAARHASARILSDGMQPYSMDAVPGWSLAAEREHLKAGLEVVKARLDAINDEVIHRIKRGDADTGYTLESVPGRMEWSVPAAQAVAMMGHFGVDASKQGAITPTQALQKVPKEMRDSAKEVLAFVTKRETSFTLTPVTESRTARAFQPTPTQE